MNEKDSVKNQEKIFKEFKNNFSKQNKQKKNQLKELFLSGKYDIDIKDKKNNDANKNNNMNNKEKEKIVELELSNGEIIKIKISFLKKYPNSVLSAYIINNESKSELLSKRKGKIFIDREPQNFKNLIYYLENDKLPNFKNKSEEKKFFNEINFWKIPMNISSKNILKFNPMFCPAIFIERNRIIIVVLIF